MVGDSLLTDATTTGRVVAGTAIIGRTPSLFRGRAMKAIAERIIQTVRQHVRRVQRPSIAANRDMGDTSIATAMAKPANEIAAGVYRAARHFPVRPLEPAAQCVLTFAEAAGSGNKSRIRISSDLASASASLQRTKAGL